MNNVFPNDQENIWDVYSSPPLNVSLQPSLSMPGNSNLEDQINFQVPNMGTLRGNMYDNAQFYSPEASPNIPMYSQREDVHNATQSRYQKQVFNFPTQQQLEPSNGRKTWSNADGYHQLKDQGSVNKTPDNSPHQNFQLQDVFAKGMAMENAILDQSSGQMFLTRYDGCSGKIQNQKEIQHNLYQQQMSQCQPNLQRQSNMFSYRPSHSQGQQQIQSQLHHQQLLSLQQPDQQNPHTHQESHQQQPSVKQPPPQQQQKQLQQQQNFSHRQTKQQLLQKDKNQKNNINTVFSNLSPKSFQKTSVNEPVDCRYEITLNALKQAGLLDITMQTGELLKKNTSLQKDIDMLEEIVKVTKHLMTNEGI